MQLKKFQNDALTALGTFLRRARSGDPAHAFADTWREVETQRGQDPGRTPPPYRILPGLPGVPNVCIRLPTGGGKTVLAAHSIAVAGRDYLERDHPIVLWLVPTTTIRTQTVEALQDPRHPYRAAIDAAFGGRVAVFDFADIARIRPADLTDRVAVVVCTIQSFRTSNTEGRRAYAHSESYEAHFARIPADAPGLQRSEDGQLKFSFVNLMAYHRPLVIVDEAHKAGTALSFDMLAAFRPAAVVEFTATPSNDPRTGSNVLFRASAAEVKEAHMIKLPVILAEHPDWRAAVHDAIRTRAQLAETAKGDSRYIRPIALLQAQDKGQEVTVEVLRAHLMEHEGIDAARIAVATGAQRELDGINLFDPACPVEFIITVEALKEGWDCSFAYVLCSVANIGSATDIEQLLGRVLRMPYAEARAAPALNHAYAHVCSPRFGEGAMALVDKLVHKMGFEPDEADAAVETRQPAFSGMDGAPGSLQGDMLDRAPVLYETFDAAPDLAGLAECVAAQVTVEARPDGSVTVAVTGDVSEELEQRLVASARPDRQDAVRAAVRRQRATHQAALSPHRSGATFAVPRLLLDVQGEMQLADKDVILELVDWTLNGQPAELSLVEFAIQDTAERWQVDVSGEKVVYQHLDQDAQLGLGLLRLDWTDLQLSRWLDRMCRQDDIPQPVLLEFCRKAVAFLMERRSIALGDLLRFKYQLAKAVQRKVAENRQRAYAEGHQTLLLATGARVEVSFADGFAFEKQHYPARSRYQGRYRFTKHFFGPPGEMDADGEEFDCAQVIDSLPQVRHWVRNLSGRPVESFWLPTSTDRFYPDFVAQLHDGRIYVIEYKGKPYVTNDDSKEKRNLGELWASKSGGKGLFLMAEKQDAAGSGIRAQVIAGLAGA